MKKFPYAETTVMEEKRDGVSLNFGLLRELGYTDVRVEPRGDVVDVSWDVQNGFPLLTPEAHEKLNQVPGGEAIYERLHESFNRQVVMAAMTKEL